MAYCNYFKYKGPGESDENVAAIRANYPIPPQCKLFYFEVEIVDKGKRGYIGFFFWTFIESTFLTFAHNFSDFIFQKRDWCRILHKNG